MKDIIIQNIINYGSQSHGITSVWIRIAEMCIRDRHKGETTLPILVKLIDARKDLSVQVHPDDDYAKMKEHGQLGKTEMWYVLDAARDAKLIYGLRQDCTKKEMQKALAEGTVMKYLQKVPIHKDDLFFIPAGTIHAIGAGALVAEIQESSNLTYRLYDYDLSLIHI